jgi:histidine triad (HIT) family protein
MMSAFRCQGISTRQHNGPAGDQDVWHYHLHVFPRVRDDGLYGGGRSPYASEERLQIADRLRCALRSTGVPGQANPSPKTGGYGEAAVEE